MPHSICQQIWKTQQWPQDWKRSVFIPIPKKGNAKEYSDCCTTAFISHVSKVVFKILQVRLQQYMNWELPDIQGGFRKGREESEIRLPTSVGSLKKQESSRKHLLLLHWLCQSQWSYLLKRWEYQTTWSASWEICMQSRSSKMNWTWNNILVQIGKGVI